MASKLTELAKRKTKLDLEFLSRESAAWFQNEIKKLKSPAELAKQIVNEKGRKGSFEVGGLYHFFYDPLLKKKLPYYDAFPLVIPLSRGSDGFTGLNLHYLPPLTRALFLDKLIDFDIQTNTDEQKRLRVTYDILSATRNLKEFKPCIKYYLNSQIKSKIVPIKTSEWETALFLPTAMFVGASASKVHSESLKRIR
jgi:hypothetical protein